MKNSCKVRFAPSPTGPLHIGGLRTALYNYLFAKKQKGSFILRIEDTDQKRYANGAENHINDSLNWLGIYPDESPFKPINKHNYRQSERKGMYKQSVDELLKKNKAYYCFENEDKIEELRQQAKKQGKAFIYGIKVRKKMENSLNLTSREVELRLKQNKPHVVRMRVPENRTIRCYDIVRGEISFNSNVLDDKVLIKTDGMPTYHLANVVDDYQMQISHVIRGEEWLSSLPIHVLLYEAFGWEAPKFAHLPLLLKPSGKGKLSKRDGEKHGFPVLVLPWKSQEEKKEWKSFKNEGYFPEAVVNFISLLGWNPGCNKEMFSFEELVESFELEQVGKSGAVFDPKKALWFNQQYARDLPEKKIFDYLDALEFEKLKITREKCLEAIVLLKGRYSTLIELYKEIIELIQNVRIDEKWKTTILNSKKCDMLVQWSNGTNFHVDRSAIEWKAYIHKFVEMQNVSLGGFLKPLRVCLTNKTEGINLFELLSFYGSKEISKRINNCLK